jgi:hypothetical protein
MATPRGKPRKERPARPPATTPEARQNQLVSAAYDLAEKQIREGTAAAQVVTHFLKLGTARETLELQKLRQETALAESKVKDMESRANIEGLYKEALDAMRTYQGREVPDA